MADVVVSGTLQEILDKMFIQSVLQRNSLNGISWCFQWVVVMELFRLQVYVNQKLENLLDQV